MASCSQKACPYPAGGNGMCNGHSKMFGQHHTPPTVPELRDPAIRTHPAVRQPDPDIKIPPPRAPRPVIFDTKEYPVVHGPAISKDVLRCWDEVVAAMVEIPEGGSLEIIVPILDNPSKFKGSLRAIIPNRAKVNSHRWFVSDSKNPGRLLVTRCERHPSVTERLVAQGRISPSLVTQEVQERTVERTTVTVTTLQETPEPEPPTLVIDVASELVAPLPVAVKEIPESGWTHNHPSEWECNSSCPAHPKFGSGEVHPWPVVQPTTSKELPEPYYQDVLAAVGLTSDGKQMRLDGVIKLPESAQPLKVQSESDTAHNVLDFVIRHWGPEGVDLPNEMDNFQEIERLAALGYAQRWAAKEAELAADKLELECGTDRQERYLAIRRLLIDEFTRRRLLELEVLEYCKYLHSRYQWKVDQVRTLLNPEDAKRFDAWKEKK